MSEILERRAKLLEAMRSGDYDQCRGAQMQVDNEGLVSYCAIGVMAELAEIGSWRYASSINGATTTATFFRYHVAEEHRHNRSSLVAIGHHYGIGDLDRLIDLENLNDIEEKTLEEIAEVIEAMPIMELETV